MKTANEKLLDELIGHEVDLTHLSNAQVVEIIKILNSQDAELRAALIEEIDGIGPDLSESAVALALAGVLGINRAVFARVRQALTKSTDDLIRYELSFVHSALQAVLPALVQDQFPVKSADFGSVQSAARALPFQGRLISEWLAGIESGRAASIRDAVRAGVVDGKHAAEIVRSIMGTRAERYADGVLQKSRRDLESVVRSAVSSAAEVASDKVFEANSVLISHVEWISILDSRTTVMCRIRDRLPYTLGTYKPIGHKIPWLAGPGRLHFCCRSSKWPVLKSAKELGITDAEAMALMDGQSPQQTTFGEWLERQPAARQDRILGPERGKLMRQGKLKLQDFYNDKGNFLRLDELRDRLL
ncbi:MULTISPECIES: hypothetical protein [Pseudomonas]|uniref:hypothetical protein n=1 Tax=Pseudomonas TaxID=286 RepID=UPI0013DF0D3F|nr:MULTISPECIES: hypothetical protein [Pseudomonas]MCE0912463.1 hypothetical protein [Pseudomonas kurunegalensis]QIG19327.1 hypothetical protein FY041_17050 [Pseudomonas monteilii]QIG24582.1 hypothetical protein FY043_17045 [Pseudomonas monteilii]WJR54020.1 hypothetical protein LU664_016790 [Pseudomonas kurunegalensis]WMM94604.1 hypothetical protein [Pseudomonas kurunegalensis]